MRNENEEVFCAVLLSEFQDWLINAANFCLDLKREAEEFFKITLRNEKKFMFWEWMGGIVSDVKNG